MPDPLRRLARSHQKLIYNLLSRTSAAALQKLARDPRFVGGQLGLVGVLQTWTRDCRYHPHIHYLVPAGGLSAQGQWLPAKHPKFLVPVKALAKIFWVVDCQPVGSGQAALKYLAHYVFRVALSNNRILKLENRQVTFRFKTAKPKGPGAPPSRPQSSSAASYNMSCPTASRSCATSASSALPSDHDCNSFKRC